MESKYGTISMAETAENVAEKYNVDRASQDRFALASQQKAAKAKAAGVFAEEIEPVCIPGKKDSIIKIAEDEHPRADTTLEGLAKLPAPFRKGGTVTAGNASGINDGAVAMFIASEQAAAKFGLTPIARFVGASGGRRRSELYGDRADSGGPEAAGATEPEDGRCRFSGAERSLRRAGAGLHPSFRI